MNLRQASFLIAIAANATGATAGGQSNTTAPLPASDWLQCTRLADSERLACFDSWANAQKSGMQNSEPKPAVALYLSTQQAIKNEASTLPALPTLADGDIDTTLAEGCKDRSYSVLSRFWELQLMQYTPQLFIWLLLLKCLSGH